MSSDLEQLVVQAREGVLSAGCDLIDLHYRQIYSYFRRLSGNEQTAADLTQKTFVKFWAALPSYSGKSKVTSWLFGIAHHVFVDWIRKNPRPEQLEAWWHDVRVDPVTPFETLVEKEHAEQVYAAVEELDPETREILHLHYYQGLSLKQTSEVLAIPLSTIKHRIKQGLDSIRRKHVEPPNQSYAI